MTGGAAVLAPVLARDRLLVALVLALQFAAVVVVLRRKWQVPMLVAARPALRVAGLVLVASAPPQA